MSPCCLLIFGSRSRHCREAFDIARFSSGGEGEIGAETSILLKRMVLGWWFVVSATWLVGGGWGSWSVVGARRAGVDTRGLAVGGRGRWLAVSARWAVLRGRCSVVVVGWRPSLFDARCSVIGVRCSVLGSRFSVLGSRFSVLASRFSVLASRFSLLGSRFSCSVAGGAVPQCSVVGGQERR
ncbi:pugilistDominant [Paenibacillus mucilaginosus 3016]|uniref:PugilistDominant n=1 Tax=Paenibacillus mucilaginosus 3016 TaxID=1116391 RepID=H6NK75_9BACL|nr:pugilistDominant [Paenibacillus mucilaginosus 3016]